MILGVLAFFIERNAPTGVYDESVAVDDWDDEPEAADDAG